MVAHVRVCEPGVIRIPFHVGEDRSRTWVVTTTATGLRLEHVHLHEDGPEDAVSRYGGDARGRGGAARPGLPASAAGLMRCSTPAVAVPLCDEVGLSPVERDLILIYRSSRRGEIPENLIGRSGKGR